MDDAFPVYPFLDNYVCQKCGHEIFNEDGFYCCECWRVEMYGLAIGAAGYEIPDFWVEEEDG
jgi:hypothetical protein